jgi:hypothetical protein
VIVLAAAMALDHIEIGGTIVDLAFGILFGGIVLTLSLAIGLGSRDLVSRSLERSEARSDARSDTRPTAVRPTPSAESDLASDEPPPPRPTGTLRHF